MAFNNGFNGDFVSLGYILQTLAKKTILIEGVSCASGLSISAMGEVATFYKRAATSVAAGNLGDQLTFVAKGVTLVQIPMTTCIAIKDVLPQASFATVAADVIGDRVIFDAIDASNKLNAAALAVMENHSSGTVGTIATGYAYLPTYTELGIASPATTVLDKDTVYPCLVTTKASFITKNKAKGMVPTCVIVSPSCYAALCQAPELLHTFGSSKDITANGVVGTLLGMTVILGIDLAAGTDFIMLNAEGFAAPVNVKSLVIFDATPVGYPNGTGIGGEIGYGFKITEDYLVWKKEIA